MNNLSQFIILKMGSKYVFREPLQTIKSFGKNNYSNNMNNNNNNSYYSPPNSQNYSSINKSNQKRNYKTLDIMPKFLANKNLEETNFQILDKITHKKQILKNLKITYFNENDQDFKNEIEEVEMEIDKQKDIFENVKNRDFEGFMDLLSFINSNRTNSNLTDMQNMKIDDYKNMRQETKNQILGGIFENRHLFGKKLDLDYSINNNNYNNNNRNNNYNNNNRNNNYNNNNRNNNYINNNNNNNNYNNNKKNNNNYNYNYNNNPYMVNNINTGKLMRSNTNYNKQYNTYNQPQSNNNLMTQDQIDLFKRFVGNQKISNEEVLSYLDKFNPKVMVAAERYFKRIYGAETLTLQYFYPTVPNMGTRIHRFKFTSELSDLFMAAHEDYSSFSTTKLYLENGKEIKEDKRIKCIGALGLLNNAKIKVLFKK